MSNIPQPVNQSAQDDVDRIMIRSRLNEAIASLLRVRDFIHTHRPTGGRDKAIQAAERAIKSLRDHLELMEYETREAPNDQHLRPDRGHPKTEL